MLSPRSMLRRVASSASSTTALPQVEAVMSSPSRIGTPDAMSVPSVRQNRATAIFRRSGPSDRQREQPAVDDAAAGRRRGSSG